MKNKFKLVICAIMLVTGLFVNPLKINANDQTSFALPTPTNQTVSYSVYHKTSSSITLNITWRYLSDGVTSMTYVSSSCVHENGGTCQIAGYSVDGQSNDNSNTYMQVIVKMTGTYNGKTYKVKEVFEIQRNVVRSHYTTTY